MTKVLTLTSWYPPHHTGGYEVSCLDVMTRLITRGHDVRVLCSDQNLAYATVPDPEHEVRVHRELRAYFRDGEFYNPGFRERLAIERWNHRVLERHLADYRPDVVNVWHMGAVSLGLLRQLEISRTPIVYAICDDWLAYGESVDAWTAPFASGLIRLGAGRAIEAATRVPTVVGDLGATGAFCFVSESTRKRAIAGTPWRFPRSTVVFSGIDRQLFRLVDDPPRQRWRWRLLYAGRLDPRKGVDTAVAALPLLPPTATLRCATRGTQAEQSDVEDHARALGVADQLEMLPPSREGLPKKYRESDVLVFPSRWEEPFGLVPVEAMACGTPVVATGTGGSAEFLRDGYNCLLFRAGDPQSLAAAVRRLHDDPTLRRRLVEGGLRTAAELDVDRLAGVFEQWLVAASRDFADGTPPDRRLDLPAPSDDVAPEGVADALARHQAVVPAVVGGGDAEEIKRLYVDLGEAWWEAGGDSVDTIPVLSAPETLPIVSRALAGISGRVLDAGCGPNPALSVELGRDPGRSVVSLDIGWGTVRVARDIASRNGVPILGVVGDVERLPFRSDAFDALACDDTIEHLPDADAGVAELARVVRSGGLALLATPNREDARVVRAKLQDRMRRIHKPESAYYCSNSHLREYTWPEFERLARPAFHVRARHPVGWERGWKSRLATTFLLVPPFRRFSQMIVLEAEPG